MESEDEQATHQGDSDEDMPDEDQPLPVRKSAVKAKLREVEADLKRAQAELKTLDNRLNRNEGKIAKLHREQMVFCVKARNNVSGTCTVLVDDIFTVVFRTSTFVN